MARRASPWYWSRRRKWYVTLDGVRHCLGVHPDDAPKPRKTARGWNAPSEIVDVFSDLVKHPPSSNSVESVLFAFTAWCFQNRAATTAKRYKDFCYSFARSFGHLKASALNPAHVNQWLDMHPWNETTRRDAIMAIQRAFNWAVKNTSLRFNPIRGMEKPRAASRTGVITPKQFSIILARIKRSDPFYDLLVASYDSGCRPHEIKTLQARHLQLDKQRAIIPTSEAKGRRRPRSIYFPTARSLAILKRLAKLHSTGPLFRNRRGNPWTAMSVHCRLSRLSQKTGLKINHYTLRHSFITRKLLAGVDSHVVANLAGHLSTTMTDTVYSHVADDHAYMLTQARRGG